MGVSLTTLILFGAWHLIAAGVNAFLIYKAVKLLNERKWIVSNPNTKFLIFVLIIAIITCLMSFTVGINYLDGRMIL